MHIYKKLNTIKKNVFYFIFFSFILYSCSPQNEFFINNLSDKNLKISLSLRDSDSNVKINIYKFISTPSSGDCFHPSQKNVQIMSENGAISFELPPQHTACLGVSSMGDVHFETLTLKSQDKTTVIPAEDYKKFFKARDSLYANVVWTLDYH